jgi:hypothetical protein
MMAPLPAYELNEAPLMLTATTLAYILEPHYKEKGV